MNYLTMLWRRYNRSCLLVSPDGSTLLLYQGMLSEEEASIMVRRITSAIAHMHSKGIIHRKLAV